MATRDGKSIRFKEEDVRATGRRTKGVRGITIGSEDEVIGKPFLKMMDTYWLLLKMAMKRKPNN